MREEYVIVKFWHPASGKERERWDDETYSRVEAMAICGGDESSYEEGPMSEWYFLGFMKEEDF